LQGKIIRMDDPALGRFAQADSIIPGGIQGLDRYAYVNNSPVNFTDPSGHMVDDGCDTDGCSLTQAQADAAAAQLVILQGEANNNKCNSGNDNYCSTAIKHPAEVITFTVTALIAGPLVEDFTLGGGAADALYSAWSTAYKTIISGLTYWGTANPNARDVMLGRYPSATDNYMIQAGDEFTYFNLGRFYNPLDKIGLANPANVQFINNQMDQAKTFFVYGEEEIETQLYAETQQIWNSGLYQEFGNLGNDLYSNFYEYISP